MAFVSCLLFFFTLRVSDEFKDHEEDARWRPYRACREGLVTLRELGGSRSPRPRFRWLPRSGSATAAWTASARVALCGVMTKEFWVKEGWRRIRSRSVDAMLIHAAHRSVRHGVRLLAADLGRRMVSGCSVLIASFFNGMWWRWVGRSGSPADEEEGVVTYSAIWGPRGRGDGVVHRDGRDDDLRAARRGRGWRDADRAGISG